MPHCFFLVFLMNTLNCEMLKSLILPFYRKNWRLRKIHLVSIFGIGSCSVFLLISNKHNRFTHWYFRHHPKWSQVVLQMDSNFAFSVPLCFWDRHIICGKRLSKTIQPDNPTAASSSDRRRKFFFAPLARVHHGCNPRTPAVLLPVCAVAARPDKQAKARPESGS